MANTKIDDYINGLQKGSEIQYNGDKYKITDFDTHDVEILEVWETNKEEKIKVTWGEISEEAELLELVK